MCIQPACFADGQSQECWNREEGIIFLLELNARDPNHESITGPCYRDRLRRVKGGQNVTTLIICEILSDDSDFSGRGPIGLNGVSKKSGTNKKRSAKLLKKKNLRWEKSARAIWTKWESPGVWVHGVYVPLRLKIYDNERKWCYGVRMNTGIRQYFKLSEN